jgi:hypothetical protein
VVPGREEDGSKQGYGSTMVSGLRFWLLGKQYSWNLLRGWIQSRGKDRRAAKQVAALVALLLEMSPGECACLGHQTRYSW